MDLSEAMKLALTKGHNGNNQSASSAAHSAQQADQGAGYVTEKLYMLLQLYLQNKGWNPSVELLQCFAELKDTPVLPNAAYLQVLASRVALDTQGRLVLRESGKIVLPYEHFANAVMLKHMSGPHGLHLSVEATVRAVMDSYTIGRENLGMDKEFVVEVVQSCPSPACRYYKGHMGVGPFIDQSFNPASQINSDYLAHLQQLGQSGLDIGAVDTNSSKASSNLNLASSNQVKITKSNPTQQQQQQITAAIIQQQNRAMAQQSLEKFGNLSTIEKQRVLQQLDKKHFEVAQSQVNSMTAQIVPSSSNMAGPSSSSSSTASIINAINSQQQQQQPPTTPTPQPLLHQPQLQAMSVETSHKLNEYIRAGIDPLETLSSSNKDLLALHNGAWACQDQRDGMLVGQDKIIRAFSELMRNITRMKTFIRPSMCKPYGKQSESLQKTLLDTIQLVQSLRNCLPAPHIPVSSWKSEDRHRKDPETV